MENCSSGLICSGAHPHVTMCPKPDAAVLRYAKIQSSGPGFQVVAVYGGWRNLGSWHVSRSHRAFKGLCTPFNRPT